ncbi:hypothetical protein [Peribacillus sp. NPDC096540]|uniref:hypothetical protein n=1 Tax=Peribacillus sp. NPDC096540 TaxID=3390612 RepID=UPI003CFD1EFE
MKYEKISILMSFILQVGILASSIPSNTASATSASTVYLMMVWRSLQIHLLAAPLISILFINLSTHLSINLIVIPSDGMIYDMYSMYYLYILTWFSM